MQKLSLSDAGPDTPLARNVERLKALFPELVTESEHGASVNVDVLKQLVGDQTVTDAEEKYGLNWFGKRRARQLALTPSLGTLRPCPDESVDWDKTRNLMIEGDNLEVLKLLQKSYAGKVKLIYIDPPYNTGNDFVYPDDFTDGIRNYKELTGQTEDGKTLTSNPESSGRYHTSWLNMMYPRLRVARALLSGDGVFCVSIGDEEVSNLKLVLDEVFGEENHRNTIILRRYDKNLSRQFMESGLASLAVGYEYVLVYTKNVETTLNPVFRSASEARQQNGYWKGFWNAADRPTMRYELLGVLPESGQWKWKKESADAAVSNYLEYLNKHSKQETLEQYWQRTGRNKKFIRRKPTGRGTNSGVEHWVPPSDGVLRSSNWTDILASNSADSFDLPFPNPKNVNAIQLLIQLCTSENDMVLDFFSGSATTAYAVMRQSTEHNGSRRFVLIQLPEPIDSSNKEQQEAAAFCKKEGFLPNIAEITKERLRRAGAKVKADNPEWEGDAGFRVFKLDSSNLRTWNTATDDLKKSLLEHVEHLKSDRSEADIFCELLLRLGLDLATPIEERQVTGKTIHCAGKGVLFACLAPSITRKDAEALALGIIDWRKELAPDQESTAVFRDDAFADEATKANLTAILRQHGFDEKRIRSL